MQTALSMPEVTDPAPGRVEQAAQRSVDAGNTAGVLEPTDEGLSALLVALGRSVDQASAARDSRGTALLAKELRETAGRLRLDPTSRGLASDDSFTTLMADLNRAEHSASPGLRHPPHP